MTTLQRLATLGAVQRRDPAGFTYTDEGRGPIIVAVHGLPGGAETLTHRDTPGGTRA